MLAPIILREVGKIIGQLKRSGFSILLVEQNFPMVFALGNYIYILSKGTIVYGSTPKDLKDNDEVKTKYLSVAG